MNYTELKEQTLPQLRARLAKNQEQLRELNFRNASRQLKNVHELAAARKTVAQINTELAARANAAAKPVA